MDNGFLMSCYDMCEHALAAQFLQDIYKMSFEDAIVHYFKVITKQLPFE